MKTLGTFYQELQQIAGFELGWGRGPDFGDRAWDDDEQETIKDCIKSALSRFYWPDIDNTGKSHPWSFLDNHSGVVTLNSGSFTVTMPDDFLGLVRRPYVFNEDEVEYPIDILAEVRARRAIQPAATGRPTMAEIEPIKGTGDGGQKFRMVVWPTADQEYTIRVPYSILPLYLTGERPYAYGGNEHGETIRAAVRAAAENIVDGGPGPFEEMFQRRLRVSVSQDRKKRPTNLGYNGDPGAGLDEPTRARRFPTVTYTPGFDGRI